MILLVLQICFIFLMACEFPVKNTVPPIEKPRFVRCFQFLPALPRHAQGTFSYSKQAISCKTARTNKMECSINILWTRLTNRCSREAGVKELYQYTSETGENKSNNDANLPCTVQSFSSFRGDRFIRSTH